MYVYIECDVCYILFLPGRNLSMKVAAGASEMVTFTNHVSSLRSIHVEVVKVAFMATHDIQKETRVGKECAF